MKEGAIRKKEEFLSDSFFTLVLLSFREEGRSGERSEGEEGGGLTDLFPFLLSRSPPLPMRIWLSECGRGRAEEPALNDGEYWLRLLLVLLFVFSGRTAAAPMPSHTHKNLRCGIAGTQQ